MSLSAIFWVIASLLLMGWIIGFAIGGAGLWIHALLLAAFMLIVGELLVVRGGEEQARR